jgi:post-segregation antitoxin (ccd killing protein)
MTVSGYGVAKIDEGCGLAARRRTPDGRQQQKDDQVCIVRRMPRLQVYLPDDLYEQVKTRGLRPSELLQEAVRAEVRRQDLLAAADAYIADLVAEVGEPTQEQVARAEAIARRIRDRGARAQLAAG